MKYVLKEAVEASQYAPGLEDGFMYKIFKKDGSRATVLRPTGTPETDDESLLNLAKSYEAEGFTYERVPFVVTRSGTQNDINEGDYIITDADGLKRIVSQEYFEAHHMAIPQQEEARPDAAKAPSKPEPFTLPGSVDEGKTNEDGLVPAKEEDLTTANDPHATEHPEGEPQAVNVIEPAPIAEGQVVPEVAKAEHKEEEAKPAPDSTSPEQTPKGKFTPKATKTAPAKATKAAPAKAAKSK
jgi:hypothetical protein